MAAEEQLKIIRQGIAPWNEWRVKNPDVLRPDLSQANLTGALLIQTDLRNASLAESRIYGASVWDIKADGQTKQQDLVITPYSEEADIIVDNIKVAQFIYLLLNNQEIRDVIDTITSKAVLILRRFSEERKPVLDAIRDELRKRWPVCSVMNKSETDISCDKTQQATLTKNGEPPSTSAFASADIQPNREQGVPLFCSTNYVILARPGIIYTARCRGISMTARAAIGRTLGPHHRQLFAAADRSR
jgi:Pentapeptide repeats (8 copies)